MADYSNLELMACVLARELKDGEIVRVGVATPAAEAAVRMAHLSHGPNIELVFFGGRMNVAHLDSIPMPAFPWDRRVVRWSESYSDSGHRFDRLKDWNRHVFFIGGIQVDPWGNTNLIGIGKDYARLRFRGPGSVGTPSLSTHVGHYYIVLNNHDPRVLVERCDFVSAFGWGGGGDDARTRIGLPGGGPRLCVTPLCVMDFAPGTRRMRLHSIHPGVSVAQVKEHTGFELIVPEEVPITPPPSPTELEMLRNRVDRAGQLRR